MVRWRYGSSRVVVAGLGRMGIATGFQPRSCARTRRWQAHDYRRRAGLLRAGEIGSVENKVAAYRFLRRVKLRKTRYKTCLPLCPRTRTLPDAAGTSDLCRQYREHRVARGQFRALNELSRTVVIRLSPVGVTLAFSGMGIAPHSDSHQEASRLRLIRDGAFVASDH